MTDVEIARILEGTADWLLDHGWLTGEYLSNDSACAVGAIGLIATGVADDESPSYTIAARHPAFVALNNYLGFDDGPDVDPTTAIENWNDSQSAKEAVIRAMRGAAAQLVGKGAYVELPTTAGDRGLAGVSG